MACCGEFFCGNNASTRSVKLSEVSVGQTVGIGIAAASAVASAVSAFTSRQAVDRASRAFVWPTISQKMDSDWRRVLRVRLNSEGGGTAYDVRWSVGLPDLDGGRAAAERYSADNASEVIRALRSGEVIPPSVASGSSERSRYLKTMCGGCWSDGVTRHRTHWELSEQGPGSLRFEARRLRTWWWQLWRPKRDW